VDYLKLDGGFVQNLPRDPADQHLVKAMVEVARGLGKQTIAEFVGDAATISLLQEYGVDYAQGYFIGRPGPLSEVLGDTPRRARPTGIDSAAAGAPTPQDRGGRRWSGERIA